MPRRTSRTAVAVLIVLVVFAAACGGGGGDREDVSAATTTTRAAVTTTDGEGTATPTTGSGEHETEPPAAGTNAGVEGDLRLGDSATVAEGTVGDAGGTVGIRRGPLSGLAIDVPAGAFDEPTPFEISLTEVTGNTYGDAVTPLTPLITVDNGDVEGNQLLEVRVPVRVPDGMFAMGFFYEDGELEGMPLVDEAADHVTVATRHFSSFLIAAIEYVALPEDVGTGYRVGEDNWQFVNYGTYPRKNGICAGMSITSMWFFTERKASEGQLWGRWDDDGRKDTPTFWYDDAWALRWATKVQDIYATYWKANYWIHTQTLGIDRFQYDAFRYAMYVTGEPQYVQMWSADWANSHVMVVYAQTPGSLWVADPNYPNGLREIRFDDASGTFKSYSSGANAEAIAAGGDVGYERILYAAKSAIVSWSTISSLYQTMQAGTVGAGLFPRYLVVVSTPMPDGSLFVEPLQSGYVTSLPKLTIGIDPTFDANVYVFDGTSERPYGQFHAPGTPAWVDLRLDMGANQIGIGITGGPTSAAPNKWVDFRRFTVYREEAVTTTTAAPPPTTVAPPPPTAPPTTVDCSQFEPNTIAWIQCHLHDTPISER